MDEETASRLEADLLSGGVLDSAAACAGEAAEQVLPENGTNTAQLVQLAETLAADTDYIGEVCGISRPDTGYHFIFAKNGFDAAEIRNTPPMDWCCPRRCLTESLPM